MLLPSRRQGNSSHSVQKLSRRSIRQHLYTRSRAATHCRSLCTGHWYSSDMSHSRARTELPAGLVAQQSLKPVITPPFVLLGYKSRFLQAFSREPPHLRNAILFVQESTVGLCRSELSGDEERPVERQHRHCHSDEKHDGYGEAQDLPLNATLIDDGGCVLELGR